MFDLKLTLYIKEKIIRPIRAATAATKRFCRPSPYKELEEQLRFDEQNLYVNKPEATKKYNEYSEPPSPNYSMQVSAGSRSSKMDANNVWGGDVMDSETWLTPGSGSSDGGARVDMDSPIKDRSWVLAGETVQEVGNGRKIHKAKLVQKKHEQTLCEPDPLRSNPWNAPGPEFSVEALREQVIASFGPNLSAEVPSVHGGPREPSPQVSDSPPSEGDDVAQSRTRHISRWLSDMRRQQHGKTKTKTKGPEILVGSRGRRGDDDAASNGTANEYEWPTLLKNPANNNDNLPVMEPTGELHQLRMRILVNFGVRCREAGHTVDPARAVVGGGGIQAAMCHLCAPVDDFTMLPQHGRLFLDAVLLPISEKIPYAEMTVHVNTCLLERLYTKTGLDPKQANGATSWENIRLMPVYEDYRQALVLATHRRRVFEELPICVGKCGLVHAKK